MTLRLVATLGFIGFAIGAFLGAGPTTAIIPNPFGLLFLGLAALAWFAWKPMLSGLNSRETGDLDAFVRNNLGDTPRKKGDI